MRPRQLLGLPFSHPQVNGPHGCVQLAADAAFRHLAQGAARGGLAGWHKLFEGLQNTFCSELWQQDGHGMSTFFPGVSNYLAPCLLQDDRPVLCRGGCRVGPPPTDKVQHVGLGKGKQAVEFLHQRVQKSLPNVLATATKTAPPLPSCSTRAIFVRPPLASTSASAWRAWMNNGLGPTNL